MSGDDPRAPDRQEAAPFEHVLLTRFSAVLRPGLPPQDEDWLYYRLGFFVDACLPSVLSQRGARPFSWLVMFDDRCSDGFRAEVESLARGAFTPLWTREPFRRDSFAAPIEHRHRGTAHPAPPHLITTRIDSDDAMAVDFMAAVQAQFAGQERLFVNFPRGIQIDRSGAVHASRILSSPFLSLIERRPPDAPPLTVFSAKHARARGTAPLREVSAPVMWAQVLHGTNLANITNGPQVSPRVVADRFRIDLGYDADLGGRRLWRAQARQLGRLARLWAAHPGELTKWVEARAWTLRGTHVRPQEDGAPTLTDRVQAWEISTRNTLRHTRWQVKAEANWRVAIPERVVAGDVDTVLAHDRIVVMAEWSRGTGVRHDALQAATAYAEAGLGVLVIAARDPWSRLGRVAVPDGVAVVRRANTAYDFGSWAYALRTWPQLAHKDLVVLTNDSLVGPLGPLEELLRRLERSTPRVCGATSAGPRRSCTCPAPRTCLCGPGASWPQRASPSSSGPC